MITEQTLMKFGLIKDEGNAKLKEIFRNNARLKEVHIDIYPESPLVSSSKPFMLLSRTIEKNIIVLIDENRIILKDDSKWGTYFMNILSSEITDCCYQELYNEYFEFIFKVQNIYYRAIIFN